MRTENLQVIRQTEKTRIRKIPYKKSHLFTTEMLFKGKWVDTGHSKTLKEAIVICDNYETNNKET